MRIEVLPLEGPSPAVLPLEIAERKGLGHPDTICDALAESVSVALSRFYKVMGVRTSDAIHLTVEGRIALW